MKGIAFLASIVASITTIASVVTGLRWREAKIDDRITPPSPWVRRGALIWLGLLGLTATIVFCIWVVMVAGNLML